MAALSLSFTTSIPCSKFRSCSTSQFDSLNSQIRRPSVLTFTTVCESKEPPAEAGLPGRNSKLEIGSPVIVIEAPKMIKTFASVPCLRVNSGLVKPGDVGRYYWLFLCVVLWASIVVLSFKFFQHECEKTTSMCEYDAHYILLHSYSGKTFAGLCQESLKMYGQFVLPLVRIS